MIYIISSWHSINDVNDLRLKAKLMNDETDNKKNIMLRKMDFFSSLSIEEFDKILCHFTFLTFSANQKIIQEGDDNSSVFFLIKGNASVRNYSESGRAVNYTRLVDGDYFGELSAIDEQPRSAWVWSTSFCEVAVLPGAVYRDIILSNRTLSLALLKRFTGMIRKHSLRIANLGLLDADQRVCIELVRLAKGVPDEPKQFIIHQVPSQTSLAEIVGASRETVSRAFRKLKAENIIKKEGRNIRILDRVELEKRALL